MNKKIALMVFLLVSAALLATAVGSTLISVDLTPNSPTDDNNLVCSVVGGCAGLHSIYMYRNNQYFGGTVTTGAYLIPASATSVGDRWRCDAFDVCTNNPLGSDSVTVQAANQPPNITSIYVTPNPALVDDVLTCVVTTFDPNGNSVSLTYVWTTTGNYNLASFNGPTLNLGSIAGEAAGDNITCTATPYDGMAYGAPRSNFTTIAALNFPPLISPNIPDVNLSENSGFNNNVLDLWIYVTDATPDNLLNYTIVSETNPEIVNCLIDMNQYVDCDVQPNMVGYSDVRVRVTDPGGLFAEDVFRVNVMPVNQPPVINIISPLPGQQFALCQNITLLLNATDPDGSIQSIVWTIGGTSYTGNNITLLAANLGTGTHFGSVTATDNVGATSTLNFNFSILVHPDPVIAILQPVNNPDPATIYIYPLGTTLTFEALATPTDTCTPPTGFQYIWRDNEVNIISDDQLFTLNNLTLGMHNMTVYATDGIGGVAAASIVLNITTAPNICPIVAITSPLNGANFANPCEQIDFASTATDADGTITSRAWIYNSSIINTSSGFSVTAGYFGVGTHTITFSAVDNSGCMRDTSITFNINPHINPVCLITLPINNPDPLMYYAYPLNTFLQFAATATAQDACVPASFSWLWRDNNIPLVTDVQSFGLNNLSVGPHNITVYATDGYGGECYDLILINMTTTPNVPPIANILTPADGQPFVRECEMISFTSQISDSDGTISSITWIWNGNILSTQENFTINASYFNLGNNTVTLSVTDDDGSTTLDSVRFVVVSHSPPAVSILSPPNGSIYPQATLINFNAQAITTDVCQANYNWIWTNNLNPWISGQQSFSLDNLSIGLHEIRAYAYDQFGQSNYSRVFINITPIPNVPPVITGIRCVNSSGGPRLKEWYSIFCNASAYDPNGIITSWLWSVSGPGTSIGPNASNEFFTIPAGLNDGNYTVSLMVLDNGTPVMSDTDFINIQVFPNMPPIVNIILPATDPYNNMEFCQVSFDATAVDPDGYILNPWDEIFTWNVAMANGTTAYVTDDHNFTYSRRLPAGFSTFTVAVTDNDGATASDSLAVNTSANIPPTVQIMQPVITPTYNVSEGNNIPFSADVTNGNQDDCPSCTLNDYVWAWFDTYNSVTTQISSQRIFTLVTPGIGIHTITVTGTDCYGASNIDMIIVNVTEIPNQNPIVTIWRPVDAAVNYSIDHCENVPFNATAVDPDGDNINAWMWNFDTTTGVQTRTVPVFSMPAINFTIGNHTAYAYAFDNQTPPGVGSASVNYQIREHTNPIAAINDPVNSTSFFFGTLINFSGSGITTDRCNANTFSWIWTDDGNIMSTQQSFSRFSLSLGWHKITLFVTDQYGHSNSTSIYINITAVPNANPIVDIITPVDAAVNYSIDHCENVLFNATAVDPDGDNIIAWMWNYETIAGLQTRTVQNFSVPAIDFSIGNHTANVYAFDNRTPPGVGSDTVNFRVIQHTDPVVSIAQPVNGTMWRYLNPVNFSASAAVTDRCNATQFSWIWTENGNPLSAQQSFVTSSLSRGWHKVNVFVTDQYGHSNSTFVWINITEDVNDAPVISNFNCYDMTGNATIMEFENFFCNATATDDVDGVITAWVWNVDGFATQSTPGIFISPAGLANGIYNATLTVVDNGTTTPPLSATNTTTLLILNNAPQVTLTSIPFPATGNEPLFVNFTCGIIAGTGNTPYIYNMSFGNSATDVIPSGSSTSAGFTTTYLENRTYNATCYVTDMDGDIGAASIIVTVGDTIPTANFTVTPLTVYENETVTFTDFSTWTNDPIVSWFWNFGDGTNLTTLTSTNPTHRYAQEPVPLGTDGTYTVTLTVTDSDGSTNTFSNTVNVRDTDPQAWITAPATAVEGTNVTFVGFGLAYDSPPLNYSWDFGDGVTATGNVVGHVYAQQANRTVSLTVTDNDGTSTTVTTSILITDTTPTANAGPDQTVYECTNVQFNGSLSSAYDSPPLTYNWDFGDNTTGTGATPTHTYGRQGVYTVNLTVIDIDGSPASDILTVNVLDTQPIANAGSSQIVNEGQTVNFDGSATIVNTCDAPLAYSWYFGDGTNATGITATHNYNTFGTQNFIVTLVVNDTDGSSDNATITIFVMDLNPVITSLTATPNPANESSQVSFSVAATDNPPYDIITNYAWNFGDLTPIQMGAALTNPVHTYADNGTYTVTVTVSDEDSSSAQSLIINVMNVAPTIEAYGPYSCLQGGSVGLVATATDPAGANDPLTYAWDYDYDNLTFVANTTALLPTLVCDMPIGIYTIAARAYDGDGGIGTDTATLNVTTVAVNNPPQFTPALIGQFVDVNVTLVYDINATDPDGDNYNFSVNAPYSIVPSGASGGLFTFTPTNTSNYTVDVMVCDDSGFTNACTNGTFIIYAGITNVPPIASFTVVPPAQNEGSIVTFDASGSTDPVGTITTYTWNFGDGNTGAGQVINHTYTDNGVFTVNLTVIDNGGLTNSTTRTVNIANVAPAASIIGGGVTVNEGATVPLSSIVSDAGTNDTFTYEWDLGTGIFVAGGPTALFNATNDVGSPFTIMLRVTDDDGGQFIATTTINVNNLPPTAICNGPYVGTEGIALPFTGSATDPGVFDTFTYEWDMSYDGMTFNIDSSAQNPSWTYPDNVVGIAALRVRDNSGALSGICAASVTINNANPTIISVTAAPNPVNEGSSSTITVIATDVPADQASLLYDYDCNGDLTYEVQNLAANTYSCLFNDNPGNTVNVRVKDKDGGSATGSTAVTVLNAAPTANAGGPYTCTQGTPISFSGSATDPAGAADTLFFAWDYDNNGVYNDAVGQTPFYPCSDTVGPHTIGLNVSDGEGGSGTASTTVTINAVPVNNPPVFNPALANQNAVVGVPFIYDIDATDADVGQVLAYTDDSALFVINPSTGVISFTPLAVGASTVNITVCDNSGFPNACTSGTFVLSITNVVLPQCSDGINNDADAYIDANDAGCYNALGVYDPTDNSEINTGATQCSDGTDNDFDTLIDWPADPQCSNVLDNSEAGVVNVPPTANAGPDQSVLANSPVALNGLGSADDGQLAPLTYSWSQVSGPGVVITGSNTATPTFTSPATTSTLVFNLTVYDGQYYSSDLVTVNVYTVTDAVLITGPSFMSVPGGVTITTTPVGSTFDVRLTIDNMVASTLTGISSTISFLPAGFTIVSNSDGTTSATIVRNLGPMDSITINWRVTAPMAANTYTISTNTAGVVKTNNIQVT